MTVKKARSIGVALLVISSGVFVASVWSMSQKLVAFRKQDPIALHYFIPLDAAEFDYLGEPVRFETTQRSGLPVVVAHYEGESQIVEVVGQDVPGLGPLARHQDWMRVLLLAGDAGKTADPKTILRDGDGGAGAKLVMVSRGGSPGFDTQTWGSARYKEWVYEFIVFEPGAGMKRFSKTYRELSQAPHSWQFEAAMNVTPSLHTPAMRSSSPISYPNYGPVNKALTSMGWTWPVSGVSMLGAMIGGLMLAGSIVQARRSNIAV